MVQPETCQLREEQWTAGLTAKPRMNMLTVRVLRIEEVLWNSSFIIEIPGAMTEEHSGLKDIVSE